MNHMNHEYEFVNRKAWPGGLVSSKATDSQALLEFGLLLVRRAYMRESPSMIPARSEASKVAPRSRAQAGSCCCDGIQFSDELLALSVTVDSCSTERSQLAVWRLSRTASSSSISSPTPCSPIANSRLACRESPWDW